MTRPRIGIDLTHASRAQAAPGTARYVRQQALHLLDMDLPWDWIPVSDGGDTELHARAQGIAGAITLPPRGVVVQSCFRMGDTWKAAGCDVGFATAFFTPFRSTMPVAANVLDHAPFLNADPWLRRQEGWRRAIARALQRRGLRRADRVFTLSAYCAEHLRAHRAPGAHPIIVTPPGLQAPDPTTAQRPDGMNAVGTRPYVFYVGAFSDNKNQRGLLRAWHELQTQHSDTPILILAGRGDAAYVDEEIEPLRRALPRPDDVIVPGYLSDAETAWLHLNAHAYVQPSFVEGFGLPVGEAMLAGVPVACSRTTSLPETGGDAALYFDPADPAEMARTVHTLCGDADTRAGLVARGHVQAARFTWDQNAEQVATALDQLLTACV